MQIRQIDLSIVIYESRYFDMHLRSGLYEAHWGIMGMSIHKNDADWDVIGALCKDKWLISEAR